MVSRTVSWSLPCIVIATPSRVSFILLRSCQDTKMRASFKSPLTLYILWHPDYSDGALLADKLFKAFSRNVDDPFARTPGIPVYFRSAPAARDSKVPIGIPFEESEHTAIIIIVDDHMVIGDEWNGYVTGLEQAAAVSAGKSRLFPVAVNTNSFKFSVASTNSIRLFEVRETQPMPSAAAAPPAADGGPPMPRRRRSASRHARRSSRLSRVRPASRCGCCRTSARSPT